MIPRLLSAPCPAQPNLTSPTTFASPHPILHLTSSIPPHPTPPHLKTCASTAGVQDYINTLPATDRPEAFGQHSNAEISYLIEDSKVGRHFTKALPNLPACATPLHFSPPLRVGAAPLLHLSTIFLLYAPILVLLDSSLYFIPQSGASHCVLCPTSCFPIFSLVPLVYFI